MHNRKRTAVETNTPSQAIEDALQEALFMAGFFEKALRDRDTSIGSPAVSPLFLEQLEAIKKDLIAPSGLNKWIAPRFDDDSFIHRG